MTLLLALGWTIVGVAEGLSSLVAGLAVVIPNAYFAWRVVAVGKQGVPLDQARALLGNTVVKLLLSLGLLVLIFSTYRPEPLAFFATFIVVLVVHLMASLVDGPPRSRTKGV
ncbi:MAG: hypothetical protein HC809_01185 [Gammaproteobacteria bacterium]|nr:hypothetical protein [Gammaproteobacteria bacterium]